MEREMIIHGRAEIRANFSSSVEVDIDLNTRREFPYLQATLYYFVYHISILITRRIKPIHV